MKSKSVLRFEIFSAIFIAICGTMLHFLFDWTSGNFSVSFFSAINESVWEHLKLLFFPMLITTIIGFVFLRPNYPNFLFAQAISILASLAFIIIFFYTYTGIIGEHIPLLDIGSFFFAIFIALFIFNKLIYKEHIFTGSGFIAFLCIFTLCVSFIVFTYFTPHIPLFKDTTDNTYGVFLNT